MRAGAVMRTLQEWRADRGLTLEMLAAKTGHRVSTSTVGRIERGEVTPERRTREDIATALGVSVEDISWPTRPKES